MLMFVTELLDVVNHLRKKHPELSEAESVSLFRWNGNRKERLVGQLERNSVTVSPEQVLPSPYST
jgi:hypothetical protein